MSKQADLTPPLGVGGGTCKVVQRIEEKVRTPSLREDLAEKVEHGEKLTNPEAAYIYDMGLPERGGGLFTSIRISAHAQYRMDQRGVTVTDLRSFFTNLSKKVNDWKSQRAPEFLRLSKAVQQGGQFEWVDKQTKNLKVAFKFSGQTVDIITTFWEGKPDPKPGTCGTHLQHHQARDEESLSGVRTLVKTPQPSKSDTDKPQGEDGKYPIQGLPESDGWSRSKPTKGPTVLNTPGESGSDSSGTIHKDKVRTKGVPGGQYDGGKTHPTPDITDSQVTPNRRPGMTAEVVEADILDGMSPEVYAEMFHLAGMYPPHYPSSKTRHHKQRGQAYRYDHKRYQRLRGRIKQRQKRRHKKLHTNSRYTLDRQRRKDHPERFKTKPGGGSKTIRERSQKQRDKKAIGVFEPIQFYLYSKEDWGWLLDVSPHGVAHFEVGNRRHSMDLDDFLDEVVIDEDRLDDLEAYLDEVFQYDPNDSEDAEEAEDEEDPEFDAWHDSTSRMAYQRRHRQKGQDRRKSRMNYMRNRSAIQRRSKVRYRRMKNNPAFKRKQKLRQEHPERFKMRTAYTLNVPDIGFVFITEEGLVQGTVHSVSGLGQQVTYWLFIPGHQMLQGMPVTDFLLKAVFLSEEDTDEMFALVDSEVGLLAYDLDDEEEALVEEEVAEANLEKLAEEIVADFLREQRPPDMSSDTKYDRANNHGEWGRSDRERLEDISEWSGTNSGNPGSKVLPSGAGHVEKQAALIQDIRQGCSPDLEGKAKGLKVSLRRVDAGNAMWLFDVQGSQSPYRVRLQATRKGNVKSVAKVHVRVSCSCPFWQWQGPEHWASQGDYLFGKPVGTASKPDAKDPNGQHRACKHVLAVMNHVTARKWDVPELRTKQGALRFLADTLDQRGVIVTAALDPRIERLAARYLASQEVQ